MEIADTIVAPATPSGEAALGLIRVSGPLAPTLARDALALTAPLPRKATLAHYQDLQGNILDQLIVISYPTGQSFTGEALLELIPHGNPFLIRKLIDDLLSRGCRLAEPGEFSKRAFLNGKLDLSQAEAIQQFIQARSDRALQAARRQLEGSVGRTVHSLVERLLMVTASLEAYIDFPEEDLPPEDVEGPAQSLKHLIADLGELIATRDYATLLHDGAKCVILGEPNVGKSSLLNALMGEERAIVSDQPGTTRDYIEERLRLGPFLLRVVDTAGLHEAANAIEEEGIARSFQQIDQADLLLVVLDASRPSPTLPSRLQHLLNSPKTIVIENKIDLLPRFDLGAFCPDRPHLPLSATTREGLPALRQAILEVLQTDLLIPNEEAVLISARHAHALQEARQSLTSALDHMRQGLASEWIAVDLREAIAAMSQITGNIDNEAVLDQLFQHFCIGK